MTANPPPDAGAQAGMAGAVDPQATAGVGGELQPRATGEPAGGPTVAQASRPATGGGAGGHREAVDAPTEHAAALTPVQRLLDPLARLAHAMHGSRSLLLAAAAMLVLALLEPALPDFNRILLTAPVLAVFLNGLFTLPREGVAAQWRARSLVGDPAAVRKMVRRLVWPLALALLLLPKIFLGLYGIPHMTPLTGLVMPTLLRRLSLAAVTVVLLVSVMYLRSSRNYARDIKARRPRDLSREDGSHARRDVLLWLMAVLLAAYTWLTHPFWGPFTLLEWPPGLESLRVGVRGQAGITFAILVPIILFITASAHLHLLNDLRTRRLLGARRAVTSLAVAHVVLSLGGAALHTYNLLWIARYQQFAAL